MADHTDLAGVIGTWVAVSLALIALFGIIGPVLLIRRARSERYTALNLIDDKDHEFVRGRISLPGLGRINPSVNAPNLMIPPTLGGQTLVRDDKTWDKEPSATGWIMFVRTLKAYHIEYALGGTLQIHQSRSWLPVDRLWILTIGLLGRYGKRFDHGRVRDVPIEARIDQRDVESEGEDVLHGITGSFYYDSDPISSNVEAGVGKFYFIPRDKNSKGSLQPDHVPLSLLFWLSFGCVPLHDGRVFDVGKSEHVNDHLRVQRKETSENSDDERPRQRQSSARCYRFQPIEEPLPGARIISWAQTLLGKVPELWWLCEWTPSDSSEREDIASLLATKAYNEESPWIFSGELRLEPYFSNEVLLWRSDLHCLALSILEMEWSPRGCLIDTDRMRFCRQILCPASHLLEELCTTVKGKEAAIDLNAEKEDLGRAIDDLLPLCSWQMKSAFSRQLHQALFTLEKALPVNLSTEVSCLAVGLLFIISRSFQDFVHHLLKQGDGSNQDVDVLLLSPVAGQLSTIDRGDWSDKVFALNFDEVFGRRRTDSRTLTRRQVLTISLRACVRSAAFQFSFDSEPLLDMVQRLDPVINISAHAEMQHHNSISFRRPYLGRGRQEFFPMRFTHHNESEDSAGNMDILQIPSSVESGDSDSQSTSDTSEWTVPDHNPRDRHLLIHRKEPYSQRLKMRLRRRLERQIKSLAEGTDECKAEDSTVLKNDAVHEIQSPLKEESVNIRLELKLSEEAELESGRAFRYLRRELFRSVRAQDSREIADLLDKLDDLQVCGSGNISQSRETIED